MGSALEMMPSRVRVGNIPRVHDGVLASHLTRYSQQDSTAFPTKLTPKRCHVRRVNQARRVPSELPDLASDKPLFLVYGSMVLTVHSLIGKGNGIFALKGTAHG